MMKKVAVFGNAGAGKSRLSRKLADITDFPLHVLDKIQYRAGGVQVSDAEFQQAHRQILATECWIIDGFGSLETLWKRLEAADTLIYIDLPLPLHFWWVTKRLITGRFIPPPGWPEKSPIWQSSLASYRVLWLCYQRLTPRYRDYVLKAQNSRQVYHLKSARQVSQFLELAKTLI